MQDNEPYVMRKKRVVRRIYWGRVIFAVVLAGLLVIGAVLWFSRKPGTLDTAAREYWLVSMGEYTDLGEASARAESVASSGGAGYLYGDKKYTVVAACYADKADAAAVSDRLTEEGETASVFSVQAPALHVAKPKEGSETLKQMLGKPHALFEELYAIAVKADTGEITPAAAQYAVLKMSAACTQYAQTCAAFKTDEGYYLAALFLAVADTLSAAAQTSDNIVRQMRYASCEMAVKMCAQTADFAAK